MRTLQIELDDILSLISCAEDYWYEDNVLFDWFAWQMWRVLSDEEIEEYSRTIEAEEWFWEEDYEQIKERLTNFKTKYILWNIN